MLAETRARISGWFASLLTPMKTPSYGGRMDTYFERFSRHPKVEKMSWHEMSAERRDLQNLLQAPLSPIVGINHGRNVPGYLDE